MAAVAENTAFAEPAPTKKARSKKALNPKIVSSNEANIVAAEIPEPSPVAAQLPENSAEKENHESLTKKKKKKGASKGKQQSSEMSSFEKQLQEMQEQLEKLKIEKEQTEEILKAKDESLKQKEEELETRDREQEKLKVELKKLQKIKEFKPTVTFPLGFALKDQELEKKEKKKNGTKRPTPPYGLWCKDQWNEVKKTNPDAKFEEVSHLLGAKWKTVTAEEKKPYEERYAAEKEAYLKIVGNEKRENEAMKLLEEEHKQKTAIELLEQYLQFKQEAEKENTKKAKKEKDPLKPKHPMTAYFIFSNERRAALLAENKNVLEVAKITGEEWKNMTDKQKSPYEKIALKNKEQYAQEMGAYKQKKEEEAASLKKDEEEFMEIQKQEAMQLLKKKEKTDTIMKKNKEEVRQKKEKIVDPNKPKRPASSFFLFSKEERKNLVEERPGVSSSTITALISVKWKKMSEEEKQSWNEKAGEAMDAYKKELEAYNQKLAAEEEAKK